MRSWCFDSQATTSGGVTTYDREYGTEEIREVIGKLIGNGVYANPSTNMQVIADSGMAVRVQPGFCWIKGAFGAIDTAENLVLDASPNGRTDLVVARFDLSLSYRSIRLAVIKGTNGSTASPALTRNNSVYDIQLAKINVRAGTTSIAQSDISDTRYNNTVCGIVTGVINQIDTANLFAQYQSSFNAFMAGLENTLSGDVAGNLLTLITEHKNKTDNPHQVTASQIKALPFNTSANITDAFDNANPAGCYYVSYSHTNHLPGIRFFGFLLIMSTGEDGVKILIAFDNNSGKIYKAKSDEYYDLTDTDWFEV